ncbi:MAG: TonB-dependent receptor, partial [Phyllobacteriaceae bacterium]|nr:TonB-dependent receptor [Phyllobacteriaceae bacterium]
MSTSRRSARPTSPTARTSAALAAALLATPCVALADDAGSDLGVVVVSANRTPTEEAAIGSSVTVVTRSEIEKSGAVLVQDYLTRLPGLGFSQPGGPGSTLTVDMRGMGASYVLVRIDGIDVSDPTGTRSQAALEHLTLGDVERIEILRGSQSALYGGTAVAGVIDITTRAAAEKGIHHALTVGGGSYGTASGAYTLSAATDAFEGSATIQRYHTDGFSSADEHNGNTERDGYDQTTASLNAAWRIS